MKGKILFVIGLGVGYVAGSAAGRKRYEQIKSKADAAWNQPQVQKAVHNAEAFVADRAPIVQEKLADAVKAAPGVIKDAAAKVRGTADDVADKAGDTADDLADKAGDVADEAEKKADDLAS
ncbi:YtxH domain-containing protein [Subtercola boreus]|uniref:YtxH domain-containing protein n=1 Tax=Subtercola boreus TaxID=120213 RepID=UPI001C0EBF1C|nr:YtxH domain-containing protein [Subtercola boreus]